MRLQLSGHVMTWHARLAHSPRAVQRRLERKCLLHPGRYLHCRGRNGDTQISTMHAGVPGRAGGDTPGDGSGSGHASRQAGGGGS